MEMGNILAGVYLTAIHEFCQLDICHTVPMIAIDMIQSLLDEFIVTLSRQARALVLIENEFIVEEIRIRTFLLIVPAVQSVRILVDSIAAARMAYGSA
jgi:chemotaxis protein CheY-P-specific phosphatase CheC